MNSQWPLYEVFIRARSGLEHKHVGSIHDRNQRARRDTPARFHRTFHWEGEARHRQANTGRLRRVRCS